MAGVAERDVAAEVAAAAVVGVVERDVIAVVDVRVGGVDVAPTAITRSRSSRGCACACNAPE